MTEVNNGNYENLHFFKAGGFRSLKEQLNRISGASRVVQFVGLANGMIGAFVEMEGPVVKVKIKDELAKETKTEKVKPSQNKKGDENG